jgi:hypothetical protein
MHSVKLSGKVYILFVAVLMPNAAWSQVEILPPTAESAPQVKGVLRPAAPVRPITDAEKSAFADKLRKELKDPESARFRWNNGVRNLAIYCGFINAKNSYGAYTGFRAFLVIFGAQVDGKPHVSSASIDGGAVYSRSRYSYGRYIGESAEVQMCSQSGYNLDPSLGAD